MSDELITTEEMASILSITVKTASMWRWKGVGPRYVKFPGTGARSAVRYRRADVQAWLDGLEWSDAGQGEK